ncbi:hypothetical protein GIX77_06895 [Lactobacillus reuteri]|uniref:Uncharacterized protein n=1 Tax=Limosilactobacillus reuteri TaxID=1598 RepID=A0A7X2G4I4_LIMRT|nr:hypothetical protein [Limosilactobacillus reuteri]MRH72224.1 hypothetical protein [Limosilactobacillus reuteri]MRH80483.1 hypothetical protein [Limosilactobacillus reuteri]
MKELKIFLISSAFFFLFVITHFILIPLNLHYNAYYYATHMPHKRNQYPFIAVINVRSDVPIARKYVPGYKIKYFGDVREGFNPQIQRKNIAQDNDLLNILQTDAEYYPNASDANFDNENIEDDKFTIDFESDGKIDKIERGKGMPNYAEKLILSELDRIQSEIKHNVPEPSINLQWLWNMKFEKRYSNQY